jgi:hypothetical protein
MTSFRAGSAMCCIAFGLLVGGGTQGWAAIQLELVSQQPAAAVVGQPLTITFRFQHDGAPPSPTYARVVWAEPGEDVLSGEDDSLEAANGLPKDVWHTFTRTWTPCVAGVHRLYVRPGNQGLGWHTSPPLQFDVAVAYATADQAKTQLQIGVTHSPPNPVAQQQQRGVPDHRDKITLTVTVANPPPSVYTRPCVLDVRITDPGAQTSWTVQSLQSIPELSAKGTATFSRETKLNLVGQVKVEVFLKSYGGTGLPGPYGALLKTYIFDTIAYLNRTLSTTVLPDPGPHGADFTFYAMYTSADGQAPGQVLLYLDQATYTMTRDTAHPQEMRYTHTLPLSYGPHSYRCVARQGATDLAVSELRNRPIVTDPEPPQIAGVTEPLQTDQTSVSIEGTATDPASGLAAVEWSTNKQTWQATQGTAQWSLQVPTHCADQQKKESTVYVRARDNAGNVTAPADYFTRKIICDRRHPRVVDHFITDTSMFDDFPSGIRGARAPDRGTPTMDDYYFICVKIENVSDAPQSIDFGWKDQGYSVVRRPQTGGGPNWYWDENMDAPQTWGPVPIPLEGKETIWVNMPFKHRWDWIPPRSFGDFLYDLVTAYIPVINHYIDYVQFSQWGDTMHYFIPWALWETGPRGTSANLSAGPPTVTVTIKVSAAKQAALYGSVSACVAGWTSTGAGMILVFLNPPAGAALLVAEAGFIALSHALYAAAYDPEPDYKHEVTLRPLQAEALARLEDLEPRDPLRRGAEAAVEAARSGQALFEAYTRYLGAVEAKDARWAKTHARAAEGFAKEASRQVRQTGELVKVATRTLAGAKPEERKLALEQAKSGELPPTEAEVLRALGFSDKDLVEMARPHGEAMAALLDAPDVAGQMPQRLSKALEAFAREMGKAAK